MSALEAAAQLDKPAGSPGRFGEGLSTDEQLDLSRTDALSRCRAEQIQGMADSEIAQVQVLLGHGMQLGRWQTPRAWAQGKSKTLLDIDIAGRIRHYLSKEPSNLLAIAESANPDLLAGLVGEGVLVVSRLALLCRLVPSATGFSSRKPNRPPTVCDNVYIYWPTLVARAISRTLASDRPRTAEQGLLRRLTKADVDEFRQHGVFRKELDRLQTLVSRRQWCDAPERPRLPATTDPSQAAAQRAPRKPPVPHPPLPDDWLSEIGPRLLWVVEELAPNLLTFLEEDFPNHLKRLDWQAEPKTISSTIQHLLAFQFREDPWRTRAGQLLKPPFPLKNSSTGKAVDRYEWPPRGWDQIQTLSQVVQGANLFFALLLTGGRISEVRNLGRNCVSIARSGKQRVRGFTYKLSSSLFGEVREWPAPPLLVQCLGQQARLAQAWARLPEDCAKGMPTEPRYGDDLLWVSLGFGGASDGDLSINAALRSLADRVGLTQKPGGKQVHAHRFRKTVARLAGVALWNSPLVLRRLFGHKSIEMTLHYILSDPQIREEAEQVLRELRVMHAAETIEEIHDALLQNGPLPSHGGQGGERLIDAVVSETRRLESDGRVWDEGSAYDLASLLTVNGTGWRLVRENVVCAKTPAEPGACKGGRAGQPNVAGCKPDCVQRIQLARGKRDVELIVAQYIDIAEQAHRDGQALVLVSAFEGLQSHIGQFADVAESFGESFARVKHWAELAQME